MKGLDWTNESYTRLFRRDTAAWELLGEEGQQTYLGLLRKMDRSGVVPLDGEPAPEAVAALLHWNLERVQVGLDRLLRREFLILDREHDCLLDPEFLVREEAAASNKQRQREFRERRRSRTITKSYEEVTSANGRSQRVTPCSTVPFSEVVSPSEVVVDIPYPEAFVGSPKPEPTPQPKFLDEEREKNQELNWRLLQCWEVHLEARARFFAGENGYRPGRTPTLTKAIAKTVRTALLEHDAHLLRPDQRLEWVQTSAVRAAGIGLFMDPWCTGKANNNRVGIDEGARYFLESDRAWRPQRGKPDPIPRFAELYWSTKDAQEHHHQRELAAGATLQRALSDAGGLELPLGVARPEDEPN